MKHILFVCTGNTCRSPMAAALMKDFAQQKAMDIEIKSAGISAVEGAEVSPYVQQILQEKGIYYEHVSKPVFSSLIDWADLVLTMTLHHKNFLLHYFPESVDKMYALKEYSGQHKEMHDLYAQLDQLFIDMEVIRAQVQNKHSLKANQEWDEQMKQELFTAIEPLVVRERELLHRLAIYREKLDIPDPIGGSLATYRECTEELEENIKIIIASIQNIRRGGQ